MKKAVFFTLLLVATTLTFAAPKESRNLRLVCDFDSVGEQYESSGKYQIDLDLVKGKADLVCLSKTCGMQAKKDTWPVVMNTAGKKAGISLVEEDSKNYQPSYITLKGTNHDDGDLLMTIGIGTTVINHWKEKRIEIRPEASAFITWTEYPANGFFPYKSVQCDVELR